MSNQMEQGRLVALAAQLRAQGIDPGTLGSLQEELDVIETPPSLIRRIRELRESIAHVQVAGCPGRGPLGLDQEIQYAAVMRAFADIGYDGYIGHEWIATGDADAQLAEAVGICTV